MRSKLARTMLQLAGSAVAVVLAFACAAGVVWAFGKSPGAFIAAYLRGAFGSSTGWLATVSVAAPLAMTGLAVAVPMKAGLFNVGAEGQLYMGGLAALMAGGFAASHCLPGPVFWALAASALAGIVWSAPAVALKLRTKTHEVVSAIMLNYIAIGVVTFLVFGPLAEAAGRGRTDPIAGEARIPVMASSGGFEVSWGWVAPVLLAVACWWLLRRTVWGLDVRAVGDSLEAARVSGVPVERRRGVVFMLGGALAGLAGGLVLAGRTHTLSTGFAANYGYEGVIVAMLARTSPLAAPLAALFVGSLYAADRSFQLHADISRYIIYVVEGLALLVLAGSRLLENRFLRRTS